MRSLVLSKAFVGKPELALIHKPLVCGGLVHNCFSVANGLLRTELAFVGSKPKVSPQNRPSSLGQIVCLAIAQKSSRTYSVAHKIYAVHSHNE